MNKRQKKKFEKKFRKKKYRYIKFMKPLVSVLKDIPDDDIIKGLNNMAQMHTQQLMAEDEYNRHIIYRGE